MDSNPRPNLCLDFVNAFKDQSWLMQASSEAFERLVAWGVNSGAVEADEAEELRVMAKTDPDAVARTLRRARGIRGLLDRIFTAIAASGRPGERDLAAFNRAVARTLPHLQVVALGGGFLWSWQDGRHPLDRILWPVIRSSAELLVSSASSRIRECASETCSWLFLDTTRNGRRRWCDMNTCGNRAKARRYYQRHRETVA